MSHFYAPKKSVGLCSEISSVRVEIVGDGVKALEGLCPYRFQPTTPEANMGHGQRVGLALR